MNANQFCEWIQSYEAQSQFKHKFSTIINRRKEQCKTTIEECCVYIKNILGTYLQSGGKARMHKRSQNAILSSELFGASGTHNINDAWKFLEYITRSFCNDRNYVYSIKVQGWSELAHSCTVVRAGDMLLMFTGIGTTQSTYYTIEGNAVENLEKLNALCLADNVRLI